jgi:predicted AlkP superfamily pyrophosphatase or phosphodiesterase
MDEQAQNLILFLIDGLRPDALAQARTPVMDELMAYGASTMTARTVMPSITLPCIASLFLGTAPDVHGITTNTWTNLEPGPSLFEVVTKSQGRAASFYNWEQLRDLSRPGYLQASLFLAGDIAPDGVGDTAIAEMATSYLVNARAQDAPIHFSFIYLGYTDSAGHSDGWMSDPYLRAIENADTCIGTLLTTLQGERARMSGAPAYNGQTPGVIIVADHGGHDNKHGSDQDVDMTIPLILYGHPDFSPGQEIPGPVTITDLAPTLAAWMGLTPPPSWTGRVLTPAPLGVELV